MPDDPARGAADTAEAFGDLTGWGYQHAAEFSEADPRVGSRRL